jgi:alkanesulfonate monooxygenase SsuD/methylene tetrahydromethanopterin reductase-like flavin-dependent oxidoreductase (luciferase family)
LLWTGRAASYHGQHIQFADVTVSPASAGPIPIYAGGNSDAARRRGVQLADGWIEGAPVDVEGAARLVEELRAGLCGAGRETADFEIIVAYSGERSPNHYRRLRDIGVSGVFCPGLGLDPTRPLLDRIGQMERFAVEIIDRI